MTSAEQAEAIRQSMQDEKDAKDELVRELVEALQAARIQLVTIGGGVVENGRGQIVSDAVQAAVLHVIDAALRKAGVL